MMSTLVNNINTSSKKKKVWGFDIFLKENKDKNLKENIERWKQIPEEEKLKYNKKSEEPLFS
jgi:hypothetical protein